MQVNYSKKNKKIRWLMNTFKQASHVSGSISAAVTTLVLRASTTCSKKKYALQNHLDLLIMNYILMCASDYLIFVLLLLQSSIINRSTLFQSKTTTFQQNIRSKMEIISDQNTQVIDNLDQCGVISAYHLQSTLNSMVPRCFTRYMSIGK